MALNKIDSTNLKDDFLITLSSPRITSIVYSGGTITTDGANTVHTFTTSGSLVPA